MSTAFLVNRRIAGKILSDEKILRKRGGDFFFDLRERIGKNYRFAVKPWALAGYFRAVQIISVKRTADIGKMNTYLMRSACF